MENSTTIALISGLFGFAGIVGAAIVGYRQAKVTAKTTSQASVYEVETKRIDQVIDGMQRIIDTLQEENSLLRGQLEKMRDELGDVRKQLEKSSAERVQAQHQLEKITQKYDDLRSQLKKAHVIEDGREK